MLLTDPTSKYLKNQAKLLVFTRFRMQLTLIRVLAAHFSGGLQI